MFKTYTPAAKLVDEGLLFTMKEDKDGQFVNLQEAHQGMAQAWAEGYNECHAKWAAYHAAQAQHTLQSNPTAV